MDNEILFIRAAALYQVTGDKEKAEFYKKMAEDFDTEYLKSFMSFYVSIYNLNM